MKFVTGEGKESNVKLVGKSDDVIKMSDMFGDRSFRDKDLDNFFRCLNRKIPLKELQRIKVSKVIFHCLRDSN